MLVKILTLIVLLGFLQVQCESIPPNKETNQQTLKIENKIFPNKGEKLDLEFQEDFKKKPSTYSQVKDGFLEEENSNILQEMKGSYFEKVDLNKAEVIDKTKDQKLKKQQDKAQEKKQKQKQEQTPNKDLWKRYLQSNDDPLSCAKSEVYVAFFKSTPITYQKQISPFIFTETSDKYNYALVKDIKLRKEDRMQFVTGTFYSFQGFTSTGIGPYTHTSNGFIPQCFLAKITLRGDFEEGSILSNNVALSSDKSDCYALAIVPDVNNIIAVGTIVKGAKTSAVLIYTKPTLSLISVKIWSYTGDYPTVGTPTSVIQEARDVTVSEGDGSIWVTGFIKGGFVRYDAGRLIENCFVMRLDADLNVIMAKSFGYQSAVPYSLQCHSIQVSRNSDFLYFGGHHNDDLFFAKSDRLVKNLRAVTLENDDNSKLNLRRILLQKGQAYAANGNDDGFLYFCGFTSHNQGDMFYGKVSSGNVQTGGTIKIEAVFEYGSPDIERSDFGDCALTDDAEYLVLTMSTYHQVRNQQAKIQTSSFGNLIIESDVTPYIDSYAGCVLTSCVYNTNYRSMINSKIGLITSTCENQLQAEIVRYTDHYDSQVYSWRECNYYTYDLQTAVCLISQLTFNGWCFGGSFSRAGCGGSQCLGLECTSFTGNTNNQKPWYDSYLLNNYCPDYEFRGNIMQKLFTSPQTAADPTNGRGYNDYEGSGFGNYRQYMFCDQNRPGGNADCIGGSSNVYMDPVNLVFDQDCTQDYDANPKIEYRNIFIYRIPTDQIDYTYLNQLPEKAAFMGDNAGDIYPTAIALDQYGYVYIHGYTTSPTFNGRVNTDNTNIDTNRWIHMKTHWDLSYEIQFNNQLDTNNTVVFTEATTKWMGKRFKIPKKYRNNHNPRSPLSTSAIIQFTKINYLDTLPGGVTDLASSGTLSMIAWPFPEATQAIATNFPNHVYSTNFETQVENYMWGYSYTRMNLLADFHLYKPDVKAGDTIALNTSLGFASPCIVEEVGAFTTTQDGYRSRFRLKDADITGIPSTTGLIPKDSPWQQTLSMSGFLASNKENIYYLTIRTGSYSSHVQQNTVFYCLYDKYGYMFDNTLFSQLQRFHVSQRFKVYIDDEIYDPAPVLLQNIPDQTPTVRQLHQIPNVKGTYFQYCDRFYVRRSKQTSPADNYQLPNWITFHETNQSFTMYPPDTDTSLYKITVEVKCCNKIEQCATSEFLIIPKNTQPVSKMTSLDNQFIIQYDPEANPTAVGQAFQWEKKIKKFYDTDQSSDTTDSKFKLTDHYVKMDFSVTGIGASQYKQLPEIGVVYNQGFLANPGINTIKYEYTDEDSSTNTPNKPFDYIYVRVNKKPYPTPAGRSAKISDLDPCSLYSTTYFDSYFPFLVNDDLKYFKQPVNTWFQDDDTPASQLTYFLNRSDGTLLPKWVEFDQVTGAMSGLPIPKDGSELLNLRFSQNDPYQGVGELYKTLLVNCPPALRSIYAVFQTGLNRLAKFNVSSMVYDLDGDYLTFALASTTDETNLASFGFKFEPFQKIIIGRATKTGVLGTVSLKATDSHFYSANFYITLKVYNYKPQRRGNNLQQVFTSVINIVERQYYVFSIPDNKFYDRIDREPLVFFASTPGEIILPKWIKFDPITRSFYGYSTTAPATQGVRVVVMNQKSHDSVTFDFTINVTKSYVPKGSFATMSHDITVLSGSFLEFTIPISQFKEKDQNFKAKLDVFRSSGLETPDFISFNPDNRTLYGQIPSNHSAAVLRFDIAFTDDSSMKGFVNVKITIKPIPERQRLYALYVLSISALGAFFIYFTYLYFANKSIIFDENTNSQTTPQQLNAQKRFGEYQEVEIKYRKDHYILPKRYRYNNLYPLYVPVVKMDSQNQDFSSSLNISQAVMTTDIDFLQNSQNQSILLRAPTRLDFEANDRESGRQRQSRIINDALNDSFGQFKTSFILVNDQSTDSIYKNNDSFTPIYTDLKTKFNRRNKTQLESRMNIDSDDGQTPFQQVRRGLNSIDLDRVRESQIMNKMPIQELRFAEFMNSNVKERQKRSDQLSNEINKDMLHSYIRK